MANFHIEQLNLDGKGFRGHRVYTMPSRDPEYWPSVTDVPCPREGCQGTIRWYEAAYVSGYRICDHCEQHFLARGDAQKPTLVLMGRKGRLDG